MDGLSLRGGVSIQAAEEEKFIKKTQWDSGSRGAKSHADMLLKSSSSLNYLFLRARQAFAAGHFSLKPCTLAPRCAIHIQQFTAYVCRLLRRRTSIAVSTLGCFKVLTVRLSWCNNTQNYCLNVSITWHLQRAYSGRDQGAPERAFIVYWSALSLRGGLMGAWGSLIKLTLGVTHGGWGSSVAALGRRYEHLFFFWPPSSFSQSACEPREMTRLRVGDVSI